MKRLWTGLLVAVCAVGAAGNDDTASEIAAWGWSSAPARPDACPELAGTFLERPDYRAKPDDSRPAALQAVDYLELLGAGELDPGEVRRIDEVIAAPPRTPAFSIRVEGRRIVLYAARAKGGTTRYDVSRFIASATCSGGFLQMPTRTHDGWTESGREYRHLAVQLGRGDDGSLIVVAEIGGPGGRPRDAGDALRRYYRYPLVR